MTAHDILDNARVLVLGLGSHGGGVSVVKYCVQNGARVTVYDKQTAEALSPSIDQLAQHHHAITFSLGHQDYARLDSHDIVIKNPAIPRTHPLLSKAPICLTDIGLFFTETTQTTIAVTGTKGKSTTVSAIAYGFRSLHLPCALVGNIGIPALDTLPSLTPSDTIILEMSSFQLGDYAYCTKKLRALVENTTQTNSDAQSYSIPLTQLQQRIAHYYYQKLLSKHWPDIAVVTNIFPDHLDYYATMDDYVSDKMAICERQTASQYKFINADVSQERYMTRFKRHGHAQPIPYTSMEAHSFAHPPDAPLPSLRVDHTTNKAHFNFENHAHVFNCNTPLNISHINTQVAIAQSVLHICAKKDHNVSYETWHGVPHRLEIIERYRGITIINDSAATIPLATLRNISQLPQSIFLIGGGSDKRVDLSPFAQIATIAEEIFLLSGSATDSIINILRHQNIAFHGPFSTMHSATESAWKRMRALRDNHTPPHSQSSGHTDNVDTAPSSQLHAREADGVALNVAPIDDDQAPPSQILMLSPGCASFGMFRHEFDRGNQFVQCVRQLISANA